VYCATRPNKQSVKLWYVHVVDGIEVFYRCQYPNLAERGKHKMSKQAGDGKYREQGQNLKLLVSKSGLTSTAFAKKIGVSHDTVMKWFAGHNLGYLKRSDEICKALGISVIDLYRDEEKSPQIGRSMKLDKDQEIAYLRGQVDALEAVIVSLVRSGGSNLMNGVGKKNGTKQ